MTYRLNNKSPRIVPGASHGFSRLHRSLLTGARSSRLSRSRLILYSVCLLLLSLGHTARAQSNRSTGDLLIPRSGTVSKGGRVKRSQRAVVNSAALKQSMLNINLFGDRKIVAVRDRDQRSENGDSIWVGKVLGEPFSRVTIASSGGVIAGSVELVRYGGSEVYELVPTTVGDYTVSQVQMAGDVCPTVVPVGQVPNGGGAPPVAGDGTVSTIDLLVVYTPASRALYGKAGIEAMIQAAVADANTAYQNSMINAALNLKAMVEVAYTENGLMSNALARLQSPSDGFMDSVHSLRETYLADVVTLVCEDQDSAGIGYVMTVPSISFAPYAFDVIYSGALSGLTLPHEIGHHMGCQHNRENSSSQGAFPYAYGMRNCTFDGTGFRTVMSYYCNDAPRIPYFSTPNLQYNGIPLGIAYETNAATSCDNVRCINATAATVAAFRTTAAPVPLAPSAITVTPISSGQVNLSWIDNATNETGIRVYRSLDQATWVQLADLPANTIAFSDVTVSAGTNYYFKVAAYNSAGTSLDSNIVIVTTPTLPTPSAPNSLTAVAVSGSQINLAWTDTSTNEDGFRIERSQDGTTFSVLTNVGANATSFADTGLSSSASYWYRIYAYNAGGNSAYASSAPAATQAPVALPVAPSTLALTVKSATSITLTWVDKSTTESGFIVERSADGVTFVQTTSVIAGIGTCTDSTLSPSTKYWYRVCAYNSGGNSAYTTAASATTIALPAVPAAPTTLAVSVVSSSSLKLTWADKSTNETGFKIERSTDGANFTLVTNTLANVVTFSDAGLTGATKYYYRVRAYNDGGASAYTTVVSATTAPPPAPPAAPTTLAITVVSNSSLKLSWVDKATNEKGFKVERSADGMAFTQITLLGANVLNFTDTALTSSTKYYYRVRAYNDGGASAYTSVVSATTPAPPAPPAAPTTLAVSVVSTSSLKLTWADKSTNETGFKIERSSDGVTFTLITTVGAGVVTYTNTGLTTKTKYYYRVRATNTGGDSANTSVASATTK